MIICKKLSYEYEQGNEILKNISFCLEKGKVGILIGLNGCGKTTLLNCIGGNLNSKGYIKTDNNCRCIKELPSLCDSLTGTEYLDMLLAIGGNKNKDYIFSLIKTLGIGKDLNKQINETAQYTRNILILLSQICLDSDTILLDDPFYGIDYASQKKVIEIIKLLKEQNKTILITTSVFHFGYEFADELFILHRGKIKQYKNLFQDIKQYENKIMSIVMK